MRIADVIGTVTLNRAHPSLARSTLKLVVPLSWDNLLCKSNEPVEEVVVFDEISPPASVRGSRSVKAARRPCPFIPK